MSRISAHFNKDPAQVFFRVTKGKGVIGSALRNGVTALPFHLIKYMELIREIEK